MHSIATIRGWFLGEIVRLDQLVPGFAGAVFRSSNERRQVIAAYLSRRAAISCAEEIRFLAQADHDSILVAAFGASPRGFRGALRRCGSQPHAKKFYSYLHALLTSRSRPEMHTLIGRLSEVSPLSLRIVRALHPELRTHTLIRALRTVEHAKDLSDVYDKLARTGVDRPAMKTALARATTFSDVRRFARRWAFLAPLPPHPVPDRDGYRAITTAVELRRLGRDFRNCVTGYLASALEGNSSFAVAFEGEREAVVHVHRRGGRWCLEDVYGPDNTPPDGSCERAAEAHLAAHDIEREDRATARREWTSLRRLAGHFDPLVLD